MLQPLLIEIGVEELPAIPLLKELPHIQEKWSRILEAHKLLGAFEFYYTPRRLVLWHSEFLTRQEDSSEELFGAPLAIAYKDGSPTQAALSFAKKCGVDVTELQTAQKNGKEVLYYKKELKGKESIKLLPEMIIEFIESLHFGKSMRWASHSKSFIRPIRWLNVTLGTQTVEMQYLGVSSQRQTFIHRQLSFEPKPYSDIHDYFKILKEGGVTLFDQERKEEILKQFKDIEQKEGVHIEIDEELLAEVVAITEHPVALMGHFSKEFLALPKEVIVTSMREHQRYFPVYKGEELSEHFIVVSNALSDDYGEIIKGNEKVLHARLSDALFFYHNDLKRGLKNDGLEKVVYIDGLGTLADKIKRESTLAQQIFTRYSEYFTQSLAKDEQAIKDLIKRTFAVSKADLMSEMVYEFTELQGIVGYYYALELGFDLDIALAIKEQYLPNGEESALPSNAFTALIAISVKLDAVMGLFSVGQIPTGSRDPFGLRRAASGIVKIALAHKLPLDIQALYEMGIALYKDIEYKAFEEFFLERLYPLYSINKSIVKAVIQSQDRNLLELDKKIHALANLVDSSDFKELQALFNRVANITKDMNTSQSIEINEALFQAKEEQALFEALQSIEAQSFENYTLELDALSTLAKPLAEFFEHVMVNAEDEALKQNRKALVLAIYRRFKAIADLKEITL